MTIVSYRHLAGPDAGMKGTYTAPTDDIAHAIDLTREILLEDFAEEGLDGRDPGELFTIIKAEVLAR